MRPLPRTRRIVTTGTTALAAATRQARRLGYRVRDDAPRWWSSRAARRTRSAVALLAVTIIGAALGTLLLANVRQDVGPFQADFRITPTLHGGTEVRLPPLGSLTLRSHSGPAHLEIDLAALDEGRTRELVTQPNAINRASADAVTDVTQGLRRVALQFAGAAVLGAMLAALIVFRSTRRAAAAGGLALLLTAASLGTAGATFSRSALAEPTYRGLLGNAQTVVGDADRIASRYGEYTAQLQKMVTNVSRLYATITNLPVYEPADGTIRVLHISDMHLNPAGWSVVRTVVEQFHIDVVVDTGDMVDWGSEPEASFVDAIGGLGVPYVYVRGNHDSATTQAAVARQRNAIVLDNKVETVAGLTFAGIGDPRFTPDKSEGEPADPNDPYERAGVQAVGIQLAKTIAESPQPVNVALVHDPAMAAPLAGLVPLVLAGHRHHREIVTEPGPVGAPYPQTTVMIEGSTGGAGLRGLDTGTPLPLELSVLYFGGENRQLQAYDEISVGGTGLSEVQLERHLAGTDTEPEPTTTPTR
ncbi:metallophosphoesterase [Luedemannella helvata]|uniref:metallophosphoesterase n=1 Tax=Luedemannella helvata TaxID=349315 RepID=UPI0031E364D2